MALALLNGLLREVDAQWQPAGSMDELVTLVESEEFASSIRGVWAVVHERGCQDIADVASNANFNIEVRGLTPSRSVCEAIRNPVVWATIFRANAVAPDAGRARNGVADKIKDLHYYMKNYAAYTKGACATRYVSRLEIDLRRAGVDESLWLQALRTAFSRVPECGIAIQTFLSGEDDSQNYLDAKKCLISKFGSQPFRLSNALLRFASDLMQTSSESLEQYFARFERTFVTYQCPILADCSDIDSKRFLQAFVSGMSSRSLREQMIFRLMSTESLTYTQFRDTALDAGVVIAQQGRPARTSVTAPHVTAPREPAAHKPAAPVPPARFQREPYQLRSRGATPNVHAGPASAPNQAKPAQSIDARRDGFAKRVAHLAAQGSTSDDILLHAVADLEAFSSLDICDAPEDALAANDDDVQFVDE